MATLTHIFRHPIKSHGREQLEKVTLSAGKTMPFDRKWAVAHDAAKADGSVWAPCQNFSRGAKTGSLQAIDATLDEGAGEITLTHPKLGEISFRPDDNPSEFLDWIMPIMDPNRALPERIIAVPDRGMTDTDYPSISLNNLASHKALEGHFGQALTFQRWRGNLWFEGLEAWEEEAWIGKRLRLGSAEFEIRESIVRCLATTIDTTTGVRDVDTLSALDAMRGAKIFGTYAEIVKSGEISLGDTLEVL